MIDVTHHGDNGCPCLGPDFHRRQFGIRQKGFRTVQRCILGDVTQFFHHDHSRFLIQHLIDGHHVAHFHQGLDHLRSLDRHFLGERPH